MWLSGWNNEFLIWKAVQQIFHFMHGIYELKLQMWQPIFQRLIFLLRFPLGLCFSLGAHILSHWNGPPWLGYPKCAHWRVFLRIMGLILAELTELVYQARISWLIFSSFPYGPWFILFCYPLPYTWCSNNEWCKIVTQSFISRNRYVRTPSFASLNMDLLWRLDNLSCQDLNSCCKGDNSYGNMILSIYSCVRFFDSLT